MSVDKINYNILICFRNRDTNFSIIEFHFVCIIKQIKICDIRAVNSLEFSFGEMSFQLAQIHQSNDVSFIFHVEFHIILHTFHKKNIIKIDPDSFIILKSASNLNGNLNCSKELEHYAS